MRFFERCKDESGQMTVEFVIVFPILLLIALIAVNVQLFFSECASFDRIAREAIRVHMCSTAAGQSLEGSCEAVSQVLEENFGADYLDTSLAVVENSFNQLKVRSTLSFHPTLFGMGLRSEIWGVSLPGLTHTVDLVVERYRPGVLF